MKYILIALALISLNSLSFSQEAINTQNVIDLGKFYSNYLLSRTPTEEDFDNLGKNYSDNLTNSVTFFKELISKNNDILTDDFLTVPDSTTLKVVYIVNELHQNPHLKQPKDPVKLVDSLKNASIPIQYLLDNYYHLVFISVSNKNLPFNLSKVDFNMDNYGLNTDQYKGIFYLRCMEMCGKQIFGFMNMVKPPNTKKALVYIKRYPKFYGQPYYYYNNFNFDDFEMEVLNDQGKVSYKKYFITKLYSTLLSHLVCLKKENKSEKLQHELLTKSILSDTSLYNYTEQKDLLEQIHDKAE